MSSGNIVKLDIGGTVFKTTKSTLTKFDGFFKIMLETDVPVEKDESGCIFIDRCPKHFDVILNYMRDGKVRLPDSPQDVEEIQTEAQFYLLTGLIELCNAKIPAAKTETSNTIRVITSDREYREIIANLIKPVMIITCALGPHTNGIGLGTHKFNVNDFLEKHKNHFHIYFKTSIHASDDSMSWELRKTNYLSFGGTLVPELPFLKLIEESITEFLKH